MADTLVSPDDVEVEPDFLAELRAWLALTAAVWDESLHPREAEGTSIGGRFAPKHGSTGTPAQRAAPPTTAVEAGRRVAASVLMRQLAGIDATAEKVRALPIPEGEYAGEAVYLENGGGSFNRLPSGRYIIDGPRLKDEGWDPTSYATADEALAAMRAKLSRPELEAEVAKNWGKRLRGGIMADKDVRAAFAAGDDRNATSTSYAQFTSTWGVDRTPVILLNDKGMQSFNKDILTSGFYDPGTGVVFMNGERVRVGFDLIEKNALKRPDGKPYDYGTTVGPLTPGGGSAGERIDALIRHETGHAAWANMPQKWRDEFTASVPSDYRQRLGLSRYAADAKEVYEQDMKSADATLFPWQGEVHSEVLAATTDPSYNRDEWPAWVNDLGDRIKAAKA
jgi:hypothetical protein